MDEPAPYLMEASDCLARFRIVRHESELSDLVFLHDGAATISMAPSDALALGRGLIAVATGLTSLATTETALLLEAQRRAERLSRTTEPARSAPRPSPGYAPRYAPPTLENL